MTIKLRRLDTADWDAWFDVQERAYGGVMAPLEERKLWRDLTEIERSLAAWDAPAHGDNGARIVGSLGIFSFRMSVPGGAMVPTGGVAMVGVAATHRRRGLMRRMMRRGLEEILEADEPLAALTTTEAGIYRGFGFGVASQALFADIDHARVRVDVPDALAESVSAVRLREAEPTAELARCEELFALTAPTRPGLLELPPGWERLAVLEGSAGRHGTSPLQCVLAEGNGGELLGYARYVLMPGWERGISTGTVLGLSTRPRPPRTWRYCASLPG